MTDVDHLGDDEAGAVLDWRVRTTVEEIHTPVRVRLLPSHAASVRAVTVTTDGVQLLPHDPRRRRALIAGESSVSIGTGQAGALTAAFPLALSPTMAPFEWGAVTELWAAAPTAPVQVYVITELWAE